MGKIFSPPSSIELPILDWINVDKYRKESEKFIQDLADFCKKRKPKNEYVGKTVRFSVADGYAQYMVASVKPLELIHIPLDDAYQEMYIHRLTWKDIKTKIDGEEALEKFLKEHREKNK